jgi:hypothetical protein
MVIIPLKKTLMVKMGWYKKDGFEVLCIEENGKYLIYKCKLLNKMMLEKGGQIL